ncbi:hypothetical protein [Mesorhizobium sp. WSM2240]
MQDRELETFIYRLKAQIAASRVFAAGLRLQLAFKQNPNWHLQPRVPAGDPDGGQWLAYLVGAAGSLLPVLQRVGLAALQRLRTEARRIGPVLRRLPRRWDDSLQPSEDSYDDETRRISHNSWQRRGEPNIRFRNEDELRRYLGPAGPGREWHHIVEKRLAGREGFPPEKIHSTDNIVSLPIEVHRRVSARMSMRDKAYNFNIRRFGIEKRTFAEQYDDGLDLVREILEDYGYDPSDF